MNLKSDSNFRIWRAGFVSNGIWSVDRARLAAEAGRPIRKRVLQNSIVPVPIPAPQPGPVPLDQHQNQMELHSAKQVRTQSEQQTQDDIHQISPLRPTEQLQTNVPLTDHYRSLFSSQTQPAVRHVTHVTTASAMFVPFLCNVVGLPHSRLQIVRNRVYSQHDGMWQTMVLRTQFVHDNMLRNGSQTERRHVNQPHGIGQPRVEIGIFQLKIKNGYLTLRQTFQDWFSLKTVSTQNYEAHKVNF
jgi:hypothetical protein